MNKLYIFFLSIVFLAPTFCYAQNHNENEYRRFSLTLNGGASLGDANENFHFLSSNFTTNIENMPAWGAGLQYALSPAWSLEFGYRRTTIKGKGFDFKTNMDLLSLKNIFNLNQIIFENRSSNRLSPFISLGVGYDFFAYNGPDNNFKQQNTSYNAGAGLAYKVNNAIDLYTHYEYHLGSNEIDNAVDGWGADMINSFTGGLRIHFGKKGRSHLSWRPKPKSLTPVEYELFLSQEHRISELKNQIAQMEQKESEREQQFAELATSKNEYPANLQCIEVDEAPSFTEHLIKGHYVQIFASRHLTVAHYIKGHAFESLKNVLSADNDIYIFHRNGFYEVMVGQYQELSEAESIKELIKKVHEDAFVITFPRPSELENKASAEELVDNSF